MKNLLDVAMFSGKDLAMNLGVEMMLAHATWRFQVMYDVCIRDWEGHMKRLDLRSKIWSPNLKELDTIKQRDLKGFGHASCTF